MLTYSPLSEDNLKEAITLVGSVFPNDFDTEDSQEEAYRASLNRNEHKDFIERHHLDILEYFVVNNFPSENIIGVTGWYTETIGPKDVIWLGWYCLDPKERGKGFGREVLEWTVQQAKDKGYKIMKLYTSTDPNEATAQVLYESMGFNLAGEEQKEGEEYKILYRERALFSV